ncbi:two component system response regulator [Butyrivibrio proteoclasticus B316]|uniref:Stage 0 sporulation protein A homolog n=2 Tax=Butyrivibrio proteoclasticus TaxID=43305 RepID=E0RWQ5_BUTPB|nr:two component system response regulator [Butyrivibrio proteoclasticus B316]
MMDKILIADDETEIRSLLKLYLENEGYAVAEAGDGQEALKILAGGDISLCLLDVMMPEMDGFHVLKEMRKNNNIPVIIISARDTDPDKILGLDLGADDYMIKPFNPLEAVARVRSNLRRFHALKGDLQPQTGKIIELLDLKLDTEACILYRQGEKIELTSNELKMMELFMENPGKVFTKEKIYEYVWGDTYVVADNNIMVAISKLRSKLCDDPSAYIRTVRGLGYRMEKE